MNPQSAIICRSVSIVMPDVVSISPDMAALAPERKQAFPLSCIKPLPPASRMAALGNRNLRIAMLRRISLYLRGGWFCSGVPGIGFSTFTGMERILSSRKVSAKSILSSIVSPKPRIPPLHTCMPDFFAACMAANLSAAVWVVQIFGKKLSEASRLLCTRDAPADNSFWYCALFKRPRETQT